MLVLLLYMNDYVLSARRSVDFESRHFPGYVSAWLLIVLLWPEFVPDMKLLLTGCDGISRLLRSSAVNPVVPINNNNLPEPPNQLSPVQCFWVVCCGLRPAVS